MNTLEKLEKLLATTPEEEFYNRYNRSPANDWWDIRELAGAASALRNRQGTAARKALPALVAAVRALCAEPCINGAGYRCWSAEDGMNALPREEWCDPCITLEPLLRDEDG